MWFRVLKRKHCLGTLPINQVVIFVIFTLSQSKPNYKTMTARTETLRLKYIIFFKQGLIKQCLEETLSTLKLQNVK